MVVVPHSCCWHEYSSAQAHLCNCTTCFMKGEAASLDYGMQEQGHTTGM